MSKTEQLNQYKEFNIQSVLEMIKSYEKNNNLNNFNLDLNKDNLSIEELKILDKLKQSGDILNGLKSILKVLEKKQSQNKFTKLNQPSGVGFSNFNMDYNNSENKWDDTLNSNNQERLTADELIQPENKLKLIEFIENFKRNDAYLYSPEKLHILQSKYIEVKYSALFNNLSKLQDKEGKTLSKDKLNKILAEDRCKPLSLISLLSDMKNSNGEILSEQEIQNILKGVINLKEQNISLKAEKILQKHGLSLKDLKSLGRESVKKTLTNKNIHQDKHEEIINLLFSLDTIKTNKNLHSNTDIYVLREYLDYKSQSNREQKDIYTLYTAQKGIIKELQKTHLETLVELGIIDEGDDGALYKMILSAENIDIFISKLELAKIDNPSDDIILILKLVNASKHNLLKLQKEYHVELNYDKFQKSIEREIKDKHYNKTNKTTKNTKNSIPRNTTINNTKIYSYSLLEGTTPILKNPTTGEQIQITKDEAKILKNNPDAIENLVNFHKFFNELGLGSIWKYRKELINSIGNSYINFMDGDSLSKPELINFGNNLLKGINNLINNNSKELKNKSLLNTNSTNISGVKYELRKFSGNNGMLSDEQTHNIEGEDKFEATLRSFGIIGGAYFKTHMFRKMIK